MGWFAVQLLIAYGLGSLSGSIILGRVKGVDVRAGGSGNAGAANAMRVLGWRMAVGAALIDTTKGVLAAWLVPQIGATEAWTYGALSCGAAAIIGHIWPLWHGFRGGKGVAVAFGVLIVIMPVAALGAVVVWLVSLTLSGYTSVAGLLAVSSVIPAAIWLAPQSDRLIFVCFALLLNVLIWFAHRQNLARLMHANENRFETVRVFAKRRKS